MTTLLAADTIFRPHLHRRGGHLLSVAGTLALIGAVGVVLAANADLLGDVFGDDDDRPRGVLHDRRRHVPRRGPDRRLHRRSDDAVFVRADADRRGLRGVPGRDAARTTGRRGGGRGGIRHRAHRHGIGGGDDRRFHRIGAGQRRRQRPGFGGADLLPLSVGIRADQRTADHRGHRRDDSGAPGTLRAPQDAARAVDPTSSARWPPDPDAQSGCLCPAQRSRHGRASSRRLVLPVVGAPGIGTADSRRARRCTPAVPMVPRTVRHESAELRLPLGAAIHSRSGRCAVAPQRHRDVHVRRADAQRGQPGVRHVCPDAWSARRPDGGVLHHGRRRVRGRGGPGDHHDDFPCP